MKTQNKNSFKCLESYNKVSIDKLHSLNGGFNRKAYNYGTDVGKVIRWGGVAKTAFKYGKYLLE
jgi:hypothetical protein